MIGFGMFTERYTSRVQLSRLANHSPNQPLRVRSEAVPAPNSLFKHLISEWKFFTLPPSAQGSNPATPMCLLNFEIDFAVRSHLHAQAVKVFASYLALLPSPPSHSQPMCCAAVLQRCDRAADPCVREPLPSGAFPARLCSPCGGCACDRAVTCRRAARHTAAAAATTTAAAAAAGSFPTHHSAAYAWVGWCHRANGGVFGRTHSPAQRRSRQRVTRAGAARAVPRDRRAVQHRRTRQTQNFVCTVCTSQSGHCLCVCVCLCLPFYGCE